MKALSIGIETYSGEPPQKTGVYRYVESPNSEILLLAYSVDHQPVQVIDLTCGRRIPKEILLVLEDEDVIEWTFDAAFERICLSRFLSCPTREYLDPESWRCSIVWTATMGLPLSLGRVGAVLGLEKQKLTGGKNLIKYFYQPCAPTKTNGQRTRNHPFHTPDKWAMFKKYSIHGVGTEMEIQQRLIRSPVPAQVWDEYHMDQKVNGRGVRLSMEFVAAAIEMDTCLGMKLAETVKGITGLESPNSIQRMETQLSDNSSETDTLDKKAVAELPKSAPPKLSQVLALRQQSTKSSARKYQAMGKAVCVDDHTHGMFQFYSANRTGGFSGRNIQLQNLPRNHLSDFAEARSLVHSGNFEAVELLYKDVPGTLSQLIRTAFIPRERTQFLVADFSAIETRVVAWSAGEKWRQGVFARGGDIYCASTSQMFKVPVEKHSINSRLRQKGKIAELALGYGGFISTLKTMGVLGMRLTENEPPPSVGAWRQSSPNIVKSQWNVGHAVTGAVKFKHTTSEYGLTFSYRSGMLFIILPPRGRLACMKPEIGTSKFGGQCIACGDIGSTKKRERLDSYGPKFVENIIQATARDILCYAMQTLCRCSIVMHIHDEVVIEADPSISLDAICEQMGRTPP